MREDRNLDQANSSRSSSSGIENLESTEGKARMMDSNGKLLGF